MEFRDYLRIIRRRWQIIGAVVVLITAAAFLTAPPPRQHGAPASGTTYTATATLIQAPDAGTFSAQSLATIALLVTHGEVPKRAAAALHYPNNPAFLAETVSTSYDATVGSVSVTASGANPTTATQTANAFGDQLIGYLGDRAVENRQRAVDDLEKNLSDEQGAIHALDGQIAPLAAGTQKDLLLSERDALVAQYGRTYSQLQLAQAQSTSPSLITLQGAVAIPHTSSGIRAPSTKSGRVVTGLILGLVLGIGGALALERLGNKMGSRGDAEELLDLPVIAEVPYLPVWQRRSPQPIARTHPTSPGAEAYHLVASSLFAMRVAAFADDNEGTGTGWSGSAATANASARSRRTPQLVLITSAGAGEGKSTTAANLAVCLAESGRSTLLVDTDFRRPSVHKFFGLDNSLGVSDLLGYHVGQLSHYVRPTSCPGVSVITTGPSVANPLSLANGLRALLSAARGLADMVVVDTSPLLNGSEVIELLPEVDAVILVCRPGRTSGERARLAAQLLHRFGAPTLGTVLFGQRGGLHAPFSPYYWYRDDRAVSPRVEPPAEGIDLNPEPEDAEPVRRRIHHASPRPSDTMAAGRRRAEEVTPWRP